MKTAFSILTFLVCSQFLYAQNNTFPSTGNVGIGLSSPSTSFEVKNVVGLHSLLGGFYFSGTSTTQGDPNNLLSSGGYWSGYNFTVTKPVVSVYQQYNGSHYFYGSATATPGVTTSLPINMVVSSNGNVGIGINSPAEKLSVNGNIRAKEIKVENGSWPDYVFAPEYKLPSLDSLRLEVSKQGHLPGVPSADQIYKEGINLSEMNAILLKKLEELTLYLFEQDKLLKQQELRIKKLEQNK